MEFVQVRQSHIIIFFTTIIIIVTGISHHHNSRSFHIDRYFLPIDNVFDYMKRDFFMSENDVNETRRVDQHWIYQPVDHFDPITEWKFWQKYYFQASTDGKDASSPICIYIGGDTAIHPWWLRHTYLAQTCLELRGHLFLLEHRFYGDSIPMDYLTISSLKYLTVSQALEDIASFTVHVRKLFNLEKNKLFVFGASYGGSLAALFRRKYPHLADAAVAMSAPMKRDYQNKEYLISVDKKIKQSNKLCYRQLEQGLRHATTLLDNHICTKRELPLCAKIKEELGLCNGLTMVTKRERRILFGTFIKDFAFLVEYDGILSVNLKSICDVVGHPNMSSWTPLNRLLAADIMVGQELFRSRRRLSGECLQIRKEHVCNYLSQINFDHEAVALGRKQRLWQACTELGSFRAVTGEARNLPFGGAETIPTSFYQEFCMCAFGVGFSESYTKERLVKYRLRFGTASPFQGTRIIYTIGDEDPGLQSELKLLDKLATRAKQNENILLKVKGSSHCGEVFTKFSNKHRMKGRNVTSVQRSITEQLMEWLNIVP